MKNKELFDRTVGILVKAYFENTLIAGDYCACAVGNLIVSNCGLKIIRDLHTTLVSWDKGVPRAWYELIQRYKQDQDMALIAKNQIESTGYSVQEVFEIEDAFEIPGESIFDCLMSVVDTLMLIHEANTEEITEAKSFRKSITMELLNFLQSLETWKLKQE